MAGPVLDALRPKPFRGDVLAAGVVVLVTLVALLEVRFDDAWGAGVHLAYAALAFAAVLAMAVLSPREGPAPRAYQSVLFLASIALAFLALTDVASVLGANRPLGAPGTTVWVFALLTALALWLATTRNSAACTLAGAVAGGITVLAFVRWVFAPEGLQTFRWILLLLLLVFTLAAVGQRDRRPRHGVALADAGGIAALTLALSLTFQVLVVATFNGVREAPVGTGWGWELVILAAGWGLIAYASVDREPGPAYLGTANLLLYVLVAAAPGREGPTLLGWPLFLAIAAGVLLFVALRPTTPAPPPPDAGVPPAPTRPFGAQ